MNDFYEVNFDCLIGPTHHFSGLSFGNIASINNKTQSSNPKKAALQGLEKMYFLAQRGFKQCVLPPHKRPHFNGLRRVGLLGSHEEILKKASNYSLLPYFSSSSAMWAANTATVSSFLDCEDKKTHITIANLTSKLHRSLEPDFSYKVFKKIFEDDDLFLVHEPVLNNDFFSDEGAANHNRLCAKHKSQGIEIFVYSKLSTYDTGKSQKFPSRQSLEGSKAVARNHLLNPDKIFFVEQNPEAIDEGAFHNDVVCTINENVLLIHEKAWVNQEKTLMTISQTFHERCGKNLCILPIKENELPLCEAVSSYLFNSQVLTKPSGSMMLLAPRESKDHTGAFNVIQRLIAEDNPIDEVVYFDVSESMSNGGGPACLRLRAVLEEKEISSIKKSAQIFLDEKLYSGLKSILLESYPEEFSLEMLLDKNFIRHINKIYEQIEKILGIKGLYEDLYSH